MALALGGSPTGFPAVQRTMSSSVRSVKFLFINDGTVVEVRRVGFALQPQYTAVWDLAAEFLNSGNFALQYVDDEDDLVTLSSQREWEECCAVASAGRPGPLRLRVAQKSASYFEKVAQPHVHQVRVCSTCRGEMLDIRPSPLAKGTEAASTLPPAETSYPPAPPPSVLAQATDALASDTASLPAASATPSRPAHPVTSLPPAPVRVACATALQQLRAIGLGELSDAECERLQTIGIERFVDEKLND